MDQRPGTLNHGGIRRASGNPWLTLKANFKRPAGGGNGMPQLTSSGSESDSVVSNSLIRPLENGWNWQSKTGSKQPKSVHES